MLGLKELQYLLLNWKRFAILLYFIFFDPARNFPDEIFRRISPSLGIYVGCGISEGIYNAEYE